MVMGQEEVRVSEVERQTASDALAAAQGVIRRLRADKDALRTDVERMREDLTAAEASRATLIGQVAAAQKIIKNLNVGLTRERSVSLPPEVTAGSSADHALSPPRSARTSPAKGKGPSREPTAESPPMPPFHSSSISAQGSRIIPHSVISSRRS
ncbi:hypothetical protein JAAARDRAFT_473150 [Jaapia argillacea MUCL 33604]|uniref:Uncharacterized protein n=1 Tax=Jaapia argillacea MUCL 33604 TaxID=933084 RepID=A0A067PMY3_9AGAM|nr:hypothetical protein JAAARDRAFT_473150 [Jaapia argillacea MUCL 33604]